MWTIIYTSKERGRDVKCFVTFSKSKAEKKFWKWVKSKQLTNVQIQKIK